MSVLSNCKASLEVEEKSQEQYLTVKTQKSTKKGEITTFKLKSAADSLDDLILIKSNLDDYMKQIHERGRPLSINMYLSSRISPFSMEAKHINLNGLIVILTLLLICGSLEKILEVCYRDGWTIGIYVWRFVESGDVFDWRSY